MIDLHTHTVFSDGELIPAELSRRAKAAGYRVLGITDHADATNLEIVIRQLQGIKEYGIYMDIQLLVGVELTHVPPCLIAREVERARTLGADLVIVHGETIVEPVDRGTNLAAIEAGVDILAHPGLITPEEALLAAERNVLLEITTRSGHGYTNGHVVQMARKYGARLVINNDAHAPKDLVSADMRQKIALGAGLNKIEIQNAEECAWALVSRKLSL